MALVGTISGSNGTSNTAISGTLVIANTTVGFPQIPSDAVLYASGIAVATSDIVTSGTLKSAFSDGDEGGELFLNKATTNTTLNIGVTIDVNQNRLRFFETGGTNRGGYFDISALGNGVGTNLGSGGAIAAGSDTYVQFNDGGTSFGGDAGLTYNKTTDSLTVAGDITGSNIRLTGDIAVVGGDLTSTATTFNIANSGVSTVNIGGNASAVNIGAASSVTSVAGDLNIGGGGLKARFGTAQQLQMLWNTNAAIVNNSGQFLIQAHSVNSRLEVQTSGSTNAGMFRVRNLSGLGGAAATRDLFEVRNDGTILIGSASTGAPGFGNTTISNDLYLSTGVIAVNTDSTPIQLVSSGNVSIKLDSNNNATGHTFSIQDWNNANQFVVNENGNVGIAGTLTVTGSILDTQTTTTFDFFNTVLTGTLNVARAATSLNFGSNISTGSFFGDLGVAGRIGIGGVTERLSHIQGGSTLVCDMIGQSIFYHNAPSGAVTANFTNVPTINNRVHTPTVILSQSATPRIVSTVQIDGVGQTINWANNVTPTGNANKQDVFGFSLIRSGSAWKVLGQMSTFG